MSLKDVVNVKITFRLTFVYLHESISENKIQKGQNLKFLIFAGWKDVALGGLNSIGINTNEW